MAKITGRFKECGLEINSDKFRIVYCKDKNRQEEHEGISFDFPGFTFRPRRCVSECHGVHPNFLPAISRASMKSINREIRSWHVQLKNDKTLKDLSNMFNAKLRGWFVYYGRFYPSELRRIWRNVNGYLVRWVRRKYKRLSGHKKKGVAVFEGPCTSEPEAFCTLGDWMSSLRLSGRSRMSREVHVRISEGLGVKSPRSTQPYIRLQQGFVYLVAIMDWHSRYVLAWDISITLDAAFCTQAMERALTIFRPDIFNSDQDVQFTSADFTNILEREGVRISMDGRGRVYDNIFVERLRRTVKYEEVYLHQYLTVADARRGLRKYFHFYNTERMHESLGYKTHHEIYFEKPFI